MRGTRRQKRTREPEEASQPAAAWDCARALKELQAISDKKVIEGMVRVGIVPKAALGVPMPKIRILGRKIGKDHELALRLYETGIHEAQILAALIDKPDEVTKDQAEEWAKRFDSWALCDAVCSNLIDKTSFAYDLAADWSRQETELVKRAGFTLMASLAVHDKKAPDERFTSFLPLIVRECKDDRHLVRKAINWALRQIGKRNPKLRHAATVTAEELREQPSDAAHWIASDALRELKNPTRRKRA